jgi:hypothetical protein
MVAAALACSAQGAAPALAVHNDHFHVDGRPRFLVFLSYFDGVRRQRSGGADADFAYLAGKVDGIRVFPNWWRYGCARSESVESLIGMDGGIQAEVWQHTASLLDAAARRGLLVDLSFSRETITDNGSPPQTLSPDKYERAMATLIGSTDYLKGRFPHVLVDVQNEWPRFTDAPTIERLLRTLRDGDPSRILAASSSGDAYAPVGTMLPNMVAAYHDPRVEGWFEAATIGRAVEQIRTVTTAPIYFQEPMPWTRLCPGQVRDQVPSHFAAAAANAKAKGAAAWTFHTRLTFDLTGGDLKTLLTAPAEAAQKQELESLMPAVARQTAWLVDH